MRDREPVFGLPPGPAIEESPQPPLSFVRRLTGACILLAVAVSLGYFTLWQPLVEAQRTGHLTYSIEAVLLAPIMLYLAGLVLFFDLRDHRIRSTDAGGRRSLTRRGWAVTAGLILVVLLATGAWFALLHRLGYRVL